MLSMLKRQTNAGSTSHDSLVIAYLIQTSLSLPEDMHYSLLVHIVFIQQQHEDVLSMLSE